MAQHAHPPTTHPAPFPGECPPPQLRHDRERRPQRNSNTIENADALRRTGTRQHRPLKAVTDATCAGTDSQCADQTNLQGLDVLTSPTLHQVAFVQTVWAAAHELNDCAARTMHPPHSPAISLSDFALMPAAWAAAVKGATACESARCIVLEPPDDIHDQQPTDLNRVDQPVEVAVRSSIELSPDPIWRCCDTLRGAVSVEQIFVSIVQRLRDLPSLDLCTVGRWQCSHCKTSWSQMWSQHPTILCPSSDVSRQVAPKHATALNLTLCSGYPTGSVLFSARRTMSEF